jgi:hypothetical protein
MADFLWMSVHCLEKYMKAVLLLNGKSSHGYGHDLSKLYPKVKALAGPLLPDKLVIHSNLHGEPPWKDDTPEEFLTHLYRYGQADNRYALLSSLNFPDVLFKVDMMVFYIRRLCRRLSEKAADSRKTNRQRLRGDATLWRIDPMGKLEKVADGQGKPGLQHILLNVNPWFAPPGYQHDWMSLHIAFRDSPLDLYILRPLRGDPKDPKTEAAHVLYKWVLDNIFMSEDIRRDYKQERKEAIAEAVAKYGPEADPAQRRRP